MIALLSSGVTLGTHVPALILGNRIRSAGGSVRTYVFEQLLNQTARDTLRPAKSAFRESLAVAVAAQRMTRDRTSELDETAVSALLRQWVHDGVHTLVIFSGYWVPVVERYEAIARTPVRVDVCHLDSIPTATLKLYHTRAARYRHVWLFQEPPDAVPISIRVSDEPVVPWTHRSKRLLAHGGGWGIGTYRARAADLSAAGVEVDIVAHDLQDLDTALPGAGYYMIDPTWEAWIDGGFPPFGKVNVAQPTQYRRPTVYHDSFDLARHRLAMMCKTGGGSLLDSLWAATPIVSLEPFGAHELANAHLWERLGFGLTYDSWRASGFSLPLLERLHRNLLAVRDRVPDYSSDLVAGTTSSNSAS